VAIAGWTWLNEPGAWRDEEGVLTVTTEHGSDFWRVTHYGFVRDTGHFAFREQTGDFDAAVTIAGSYRERYDQAGLMVRLDESTWLKTGIEFVDGVQYASAVVTRGFSDWSVAPLPENPETVHFRLTRREAAIEVHYAAGNGPETLLRLAYLSPAPTLQVGPMCASPDGAGFPVAFRNFALHAVSPNPTAPTG